MVPAEISPQGDTPHREGDCRSGWILWASDLPRRSASIPSETRGSELSGGCLTCGVQHTFCAIVRLSPGAASRCLTGGRLSLFRLKRLPDGHEVRGRYLCWPRKVNACWSVAID